MRNDLRSWFSPYTKGNTVDVPSLRDAPWNAPVAPQAGAWERQFQRWPYWWRYFNGPVPGPRPYSPITRGEL